MNASVVPGGELRGACWRDYAASRLAAMQRKPVNMAGECVRRSVLSGASCPGWGDRCDDSQMTIEECEACALSDGRSPLPGGLLHRQHGWRVEHCVGPLGLGTLIVKPERHVTAVADLTVEEANNLGTLLRSASWLPRISSRVNRSTTVSGRMRVVDLFTSTT